VTLEGYEGERLSIIASKKHLFAAIK